MRMAIVLAHHHLYHHVFMEAFLSATKVDRRKGPYHPPSHVLHIANGALRII